MYALGVTGTYLGMCIYIFSLCYFSLILLKLLGDYFGILMDERVVSFPFNVLEHPMYYGSSMVFLSTALWYASPAGIILTVWAFILYLIALQFEGYVSYYHGVANYIFLC
jgi:phosphatidylethanolamine/phosphatidyl-N-methylethanolamine N-methyltransferase